MSKSQIFGMDITLNCSRCGKECQMADPWRDGRLDVGWPEKWVDAIREAYVNHRANEPCREKSHED